MFDHPYAIAVDPDHVKPDPPVEAVVRLEIHLRGTNYVELFPGIDRLEGRPETVPRSPFHFDEDQETLVFGDDIDLTETALKIPGQNFIALFFEDGGRPVFPLASGKFPAIHNIP
jgi:hypothetical protein